MERTHVAPYCPSLNAGVMSVMVSLSSWNGEKCHGHQFLVSTLLKERLAFDGMVVSDWDGIDYLDKNYDSAVSRAVNAGIDMFMVPERWREFIDSLLRQVEQGNVKIGRIDDAVSRILKCKLRLGLFERPRPKSRRLSGDARFGCAAHRAVAREAVRQSLVLLKHEDQVLPLKPSQRILVAGRNAHNLGHQCGGWTLSWHGERDNENIEGTSIWDAISEVAPNAVLSEDRSGKEANAKHRDVAVVVIGERPYAEGFGDIRSGENLLVETGSLVNGLLNPLQPYGRTLQLSKLHPEDLACIRRVADAEIPVVALLVSGRPLIVNQEMQAAQVFVAAWLPGSEGGGVADVLFGKEDFSGRLPLPWPLRVTDQDSNSSDETCFPTGFGLQIGHIKRRCCSTLRGAGEAWPRPYVGIKRGNPTFPITRYDVNSVRVRPYI